MARAMVEERKRPVGPVPAVRRGMHASSRAVVGALADHGKAYRWISGGACLMFYQTGAHARSIPRPSPRA